MSSVKDAHSPPPARKRALSTSLLVSSGGNFTPIRKKYPSSRGVRGDARERPRRCLQRQTRTARILGQQRMHRESYARKGQHLGVSGRACSPRPHASAGAPGPQSRAGGRSEFRPEVGAALKARIVTGIVGCFDEAVCSGPGRGRQHRLDPYRQLRRESPPGCTTFSSKA